MQRARRDQIRYTFDRRLEPVLRVAQGEVFQVDTEDARTGLTRTLESTRPEYAKAIRSRGYCGTFGCGKDAKPPPKPDEVPLPAHRSDPNAAPPG